jgi:hypothetical protein
VGEEGADAVADDDPIRTRLLLFRQLIAFDLKNTDCFKNEFSCGMRIRDVHSSAASEGKERK